MFSRLQRILVVLMICILPVQAMAVVLVPVSCAAVGAHEENGDAHVHSAHAHTGDAGVHGSAHGGDSTHGTDTAHGNLCCHQFASATPSIHVLATPHDFHVYDSAVTLPARLHIPELPQRPPRA
jgi:hypothetical protein